MHATNLGPLTRGTPLTLPLVLAPMAGGPSTPELCAAVSNAGGLGTLAAGYLTPEKLQAALDRTVELTDRPFGVNIFCPPERSELSAAQRREWEAYRSLLASKLSTNADLPGQPVTHDDYYEEKVAIAARSQASVVSFTFGYPERETIDELHARGKRVVLNATTPQEIAHLAESACDAICVQGNEAGGHRATVLSTATAGVSFSAEELLSHGRDATSKPIIAAGGIATADDVERHLAAGAAAVQVGTAFLLADEAGTKGTHRQALRDLRSRSTHFTRAFTGRLARAIPNDFVRRCGDQAPGLYPELHYLTAGIRAAANSAGDVENLNLWAGEKFPQAQPGPAAEIIRDLFPNR